MSACSPRLVKLYKKMSDLTWADCQAVCRIHFSCCSPEYCEMASELAPDVPHTEHPTLFFMGLTGCTMPPHFRPLCTLHHCDISDLGFKKGDMAWTRRYFILRAAINEAEEREGRL